MLPAFPRLGHECQDLLSPCDGMHVCTDMTSFYALIRKSFGGMDPETMLTPRENPLYWRLRGGSNSTHYRLSYSDPPPPPPPPSYPSPVIPLTAGSFTFTICSTPLRPSHDGDHGNVSDQMPGTSSSAIDSRAGQIFSPVDATKLAVR